MKEKTEMLRVDSGYAATLRSRARRAGLSVPKYTRKLRALMLSRAAIKRRERAARAAETANV